MVIFLNNIFYFILYILCINFLGFFLMKKDKDYAIKSSWRISEKTFFIIALLLGSLGVYIGMYTFRHKTKHIKFTVLIPVIFILNIFTIYYIITSNILHII